MKLPIKLLFIGFVIGVLGSSCATVSNTSRPPVSVFEKSRRVFGPERAILAWIPSSGAVADRTFSSLSAAAQLPIARDLARTLSMAENGTLSVAAAGPSSSKTRQVIIGALSLQQAQLPGLRFLFIGDVADRDAVRAAVEERGGQFFFEPY